MDLFQILVDYFHAFFADGKLRVFLAGTFLHIREKGLKQSDQFGVRYFPGCRDNDVFRSEALIPAVQDDITGKPPDAFFGAGDGHAEGVAFPETLAKELVDVTFRAVPQHPDFLKDNLPLLFDLRGVERGM